MEWREGMVERGQPGNFYFVVNRVCNGVVGCLGRISAVLGRK
jgi:hypothetical protein